MYHTTHNNILIKHIVKLNFQICIKIDEVWLEGVFLTFNRILMEFTLLLKIPFTFCSKFTTRFPIWQYPTPNPNRRHPKVWPPLKQETPLKEPLSQPLYKTIHSLHHYFRSHFSLSLSLSLSGQLLSDLPKPTSHIHHVSSLSQICPNPPHIYIYVDESGSEFGLDLKLFMKLWLKLWSFCILHCRFDVSDRNPFGCLLCTTFSPFCFWGFS